jgi:hypothetical protein
MPCRLVTPLASIILDDGSHVGGKRFGEPSTHFDGRSARCCQAWTAELPAARLGGRERDLGALRDASRSCAKRIMKQVEAGAKKRRAMRTKADNLSE